MSNNTTKVVRLNVTDAQIVCNRLRDQIGDLDREIGLLSQQRDHLLATYSKLIPLAKFGGGDDAA